MKKAIIISISILFSICAMGQNIVNDSNEGLNSKELKKVQSEIEKVKNNGISFSIMVTDNFWPHDDIEEFGQAELKKNSIKRLLVISPQLKKVEVFELRGSSKINWMNFKNEKLIPNLKKGNTTKAILEFLKTIK